MDYETLYTPIKQPYPNSQAGVRLLKYNHMFNWSPGTMIEYTVRPCIGFCMLNFGLSLVYIFARINRSFYLTEKVLKLMERTVN